MPEYLAPGVYVEETSYRAKSIEGVSTTTTGLIGPARFGPVTLEPDIITSLVEFERTYGDGNQLEFSDSAEAPNFLWHAVRAFFTEGGKRLYITRVFRPLSGDYEPVSNEFADAAKDGRLYADGHARAPSSETGRIRIRARFPGAMGNWRVRLTLIGRPNILASTLDPVTRKPIKTVRSLQDRDVVYIRHPESPPNDLGRFYLAKWNEEAAQWTFKPAAGSPPGSELSLDQLEPNPEPNQGDSVRVITFSVSVLSRDGSVEIATWSDLPFNPRRVSASAKDSVFERFAVAPGSATDASNLPLVIAVGDGVADGLAVLDELFGANAIELLRPSEDDSKRGLTVGLKLTQGVSKEFVLEGGNDGRRPGAKEYEGRADPSKNYTTGFKQFEAIEDISIVAAPGITWSYAKFRDEANSAMAQVIAHAELMKYRIAVLDSAENQSIGDVRAMRAKLDSKYAALYYPWVTVLDPITRVQIGLPPSGFVAGIYARNDIDRAVYKAPANEVVRNAIGFELMLSKSQQEVLNPEGINCFRFFEGRGFRLWGARTISSDPEWKYVNVRRYFIYLERSIDKGTQWAVFEPNGERLWANVRRTVEDFLLNEWQNGALLGDKPDKAYFVKCDRSTMSQNDLDNGRLVCLIGVAALKPAEFVIFRIGQWTADRKV